MLLTDRISTLHHARITPGGPRGLLSAYPPDVVCVINGIPVTRADILRGRQERQVRQLDRKRRSLEDIIKFGFVWVFDNGPIIPYGGKWLYVRTHKREWQIRDEQTRLQIMSVFPCGLLPMIENYDLWKKMFISFYHRPDCRRPQGLAVCRVRLDYQGRIKEILPK